MLQMKMNKDAFDSMLSKKRQMTAFEVDVKSFH